MSNQLDRLTVGDMFTNWYDYYHKMDDDEVRAQMTLQDFNREWQYMEREATNFFKEEFGFPVDLLKVTDNAEINQEWTHRLYVAWLSEFWSETMKQENKNQFILQIRRIMLNNSNQLAQQLEQLFVLKNQWITGTSQTHSVAKGYNVNHSLDNTSAMADQPQNALDFQLNDANPAVAYNFNYSSVVNGLKQHVTDSYDDQPNDTTQQSRSQTIIALVNEWQAQDDTMFGNFMRRFDGQFSIFHE